MKFTTLDSIVKENLLAKRLPIHYYLEMLVHAAAGVRELTADSMRVVNTKVLTLDAGYSAELPCDFVSRVLVGIKVGQLIRPITERFTITPEVKYTITGVVEPYGDPEETYETTGDYFPGPFLFGGFNELGEATGGFYGANTAAMDPDGYQIFPQQNRIQFLQNPTYLITGPILQYVSDGMYVDNATQIDALATGTILAYINWKRSPGADTFRSAEGQHYVHNRKLYRARKSELSVEQIRKVLIGNYYQGPKN